MRQQQRQNRRNCPGKTLFARSPIKRREADGTRFSLIPRNFARAGHMPIIQQAKMFDMPCRFSYPHPSVMYGRALVPPIKNNHYFLWVREDNLWRGGGGGDFFCKGERGVFCQNVCSQELRQLLPSGQERAGVSSPGRPQRAFELEARH